MQFYNSPHQREEPALAKLVQIHRTDPWLQWISAKFRRVQHLKVPISMMMRVWCPQGRGWSIPGTWWLSRASILWHQWHECPALSGLAIRDWSNIFRPRLIEIFDLDVSYDEPCRYVGREERGNLESVISRSNSTNVIYPGSLASVTWLIQE